MWERSYVSMVEEVHPALPHAEEEEGRLRGPADLVDDVGASEELKDGGLDGGLVSRPRLHGHSLIILSHRSSVAAMDSTASTDFSSMDSATTAASTTMHSAA